MPIEKQVLAIWTATFPAPGKAKNEEFRDGKKYPEGMFIIDVPLADVRAFESELISYFEGSAPEVLTELREKKEITKDLEKKMVEHVTKFRTAFLSRVKGR